MAEVPPTPILPTRMGGWMVADESLLMYQQPISGDESMMELTFEMSRVENGDGDIWNANVNGDDSTGTINLIGLIGNEASGSGKQEDGEVEFAREAGEHLDRLEPLFLVESTDTDNQDCDSNFEQEDYYGDYPPSPFLDRNIRISKRVLESQAPITQLENDNEISLRWDLEIAHDDRLIESPVTQPIMEDEALPGNMTLEDHSFTARGEKSTWAQEELESNWGSSAGSIPNGSGHASGWKRSAGSPHQAFEKKKSRQRSPSQDDYYSRRLSHSTSSTSISISKSSVIFNTPRPCREPEQSFSLSRKEKENAVAGPSRIPAEHPTRYRVSSPPIHTSTLAAPPSVPEEQDAEDAPPARPSLLSRLIARSSILRPISSIPVKNTSSGRMSDISSLRRSPSSSTRTPVLPNIDDSDNEIETARSRRVSDILPDHPAWDVYDMEPDQGLAGLGDEQSGALAGDMSLRSELSIGSLRRSSTYLQTIHNLSRSASSTRSLSTPNPSNDANQNTSIHSPQSSEPSFEKSGTHRSISHLAVDLNHDTSLAASSSRSRETSTTKLSECNSSLRRSTSQRVIGFFSDLLRTSTSSRSISDRIQTPTSDRTESNEDDTNEQELSREGVDTEENWRHQEDRNVRPHGYHEDEDDVGHVGMEESDYGYSAHTVHADYIPRPPRYVPLTRPNKAPISHTASRAANPIRHARPVLRPVPTVTSSFASAALARLPPPGQGSSPAGEKITVKPLERASNLQARRALFEKSKNQPVFPVVQGKENASKGYDRGIKARLEEKRKLREAEDRRRQMEEERAYRNKRKETVVKARPVPDMYRRKLQ